MAKQVLKTPQRGLKIKEIQQHVQIGSKVKVALNTGKQLTVSITMPEEIDPAQGIISYNSPLGNALIDKEENDSFEYTVGNQKFKGKILGIQTLT